MEANIFLFIFGITMLLINCYLIYILKKSNEDLKSLHFNFEKSENPTESKLENRAPKLDSIVEHLENQLDIKLRDSIKIIQDDLSIIQYQVNHDLKEIKALHKEDHLKGPQIILEDFSIEETNNTDQSNNNGHHIDQHLHQNGHKLNESNISDLCAIKGIGKVFENKLKSIGICDLYQISELTKDDIETIANHLNIVKEKILNQNWKGQARALISSQNAL